MGTQIRNIRKKLKNHSIAKIKMILFRLNLMRIQVILTNSNNSMDMIVAKNSEKNREKLLKTHQI